MGGLTHKAQTLFMIVLSKNLTVLGNLRL